MRVPEADGSDGATGSADPPTWLLELRCSLEAVADPDRAESMARYMKDHFPFLGVVAPDRRAAQRSSLDRLAGLDGDGLLAVADACWQEPERELHYVAADALRRFNRVLGPGHLGRVRALVTTNSWWDTVDLLAVRVVGPLVARNRELVAEMDRWIDDPDRWVARTALLHQLLAKSDTDADRLFNHARRRAGDEDFFIRKAIGWALRQYARTDPDAVRAFVEAERDRLSPLSKREALKRL
jgi:3-methyladenine DNA glycosylase AlkD